MLKCVIEDGQWMDGGGVWWRGSMAINGWLAGWSVLNHRHSYPSIEGCRGID